MLEAVDVGVTMGCGDTCPIDATKTGRYPTPPANSLKQLALAA